jgi:hypothetical protein
MFWVRALAAIVVFGCGFTTATAGEEYSHECEVGSYMTGFEGSSGDWIDTFTIYCAAWNERLEKLGQPAPIKWFIGHSDSGKETSTHCPSGWVIAGKYRGKLSQFGDDKHFVVHSIEFNCRPVDREEPLEFHVFGSTSPVADRYGDDLILPPECPKGEFATGVFGNHGAFVDSVGFICRAAPQVSAVLARPNDDMIKRDSGILANPSDDFKDVIAAGTPGPATPPPPPPPPPVKQVKVKEPVDVYDVPGGGGKVIGALADETTVGLLGCQQDHWCHVTGQNVPNGIGWVYSGPGYYSLEL